jgi:hypothetical protein
VIRGLFVAVLPNGFGTGASFATSSGASYVREVETGLPGVACMQLDPQAEWPADLRVRAPEDGERPVPTPKRKFP